MAKTDYQSVDEYVRQLSEPGQSVLRRVIALIAKAVPRAEPVISYQIAAFKLEGRALIYLAAWKEHYSVYPATPGVIAAFESELAGHRGGRGTLRFSFDEPIPTRLLAGIAKVRAAEVAELEALKAAKKKSATKPTPQTAAAKPPRKTFAPAAGKPARKTAASAAGKPAGKTVAPVVGEPTRKTVAAKPARPTAAPAAGKPAAGKPARQTVAAKPARTS